MSALAWVALGVSAYLVAASAICIVAGRELRRRSVLAEPPLIAVDVGYEGSMELALTVNLPGVPAAGARLVLPLGEIVEVIGVQYVAGANPRLLVRHLAA